MTSSRVRSGFLVAMFGVVIACDTKDAAAPLTPDAFGRIRFVNLITDPARVPVNAILEGVPFGVNLGYTATTPASLPAPSTANYSPILAGNRTLLLKRTADTTVTVASFAMTIPAQEDRTVFAIGGTGGGPVTQFGIVDNNTTPIGATETRFQIANFSPTGGAMDVFVTTATADLATATPVVTNLAYQDRSIYMTAAAGTLRIRMVPAGTPPASRSANVRVDISAAFPGGSGRTIVAADAAAGGAPLRGFILTDR